MERLLAYTNKGEFVREVAGVYELVSHEEINGRHDLTITTRTVLEKGMRLLMRDVMGTWREWCVDEIDQAHADGKTNIGEYVAVWSLMYDLRGTKVSRMPGTGGTEATAREALEAALSGTSRWTVGTVDVDSGGGASMYQTDGWTALGTVVSVWGGEVRADISPSLDGTTITRSVSLLNHLGSSSATRRFDYGADVTEIGRKVESGLLAARIIPLGKGEETEAGGYGRKITIAPVNDGVEWLQNDEVADALKVPDGHGGWEYPYKFVENGDCETPEELKEWGLSVLEQETNPRVTYRASVVQLERAGMDVHGVALGDVVQCVDHKFCDDGLRLEGRVTAIEEDLLDERNTRLTIGYLSTTVIGAAVAGIMSLGKGYDRLVMDTEGSANLTDAYVTWLLGRLNEEINATGGYTYITQGQGMRTYDRAVTDPTVGAEAHQVVEVKGGNLRIANSRTSSGDWDWKTVLVSGHIASELITAANIVAGTIGDANGSFYMNLDTGVTTLNDTATIGNRTVGDLLDDVDATISSVDVQYAQNQSDSTPPSGGWRTAAPAWQAGYYIWQRTATTTPSGTSYSTPVMISGRDGTDGTSVSILGSYSTYDDLIAAHPTGSMGDGYLVAGDLYVWDGTQWQDVGTIQGPPGTNGTNGTNGIDGEDGSQIWTATENPTTPNYTFNIADLTGPTGVTPRVGDLVVRSYYRYTITSVASTTVKTGTRTSIRGGTGAAGNGISDVTISYGASASGSTEPTTWQGTVPSLSQGQWLWVRTVTTYTDSSTSTSYTKSYVGTDGEDGTSVYVQSATKSGRVTTVVIADSDGNISTLTITDGTDGQNGLPGQNGLSGYVHLAWANSADGSEDFSTSVSTGKKYLGSYTDNVAADSQSYIDYSWSLIKGADGEDGVGISTIAEQYYLSTSDQTTAGGSWQDTQPTWVEGRYIWTRSRITWDDSTVTTTAPVLATALNQANEGIAQQKAMVREYQDGVLVCRSNQSVGVLLDADGGFKVVSVTWRSGVPYAGTEYAILGAHESGESHPIAFTIGSRMAGQGIGANSFAMGTNVEASGDYSHAEGSNTIAGGAYSHAEGSGTEASGEYAHTEGRGTTSSGDSAHAEGLSTIASGDKSHAEGLRTTASGMYSHVEGVTSTASGTASHAEGSGTVASGESSHAGGSNTTAAGDDQTVIGRWNVEDSDGQYAFIIGCGVSSVSKRNAFAVDWDGNVLPRGYVRQTMATFVRASSYSEGSSSGWASAMIDSLENGIGDYSRYFTLTGDVLYARVDCVLAISAHLNWQNGAAGNYGFDVYDGSTEKSSFSTKAGTTGWVSVDYPRRLFQLAKGEQLQLRRYRPANAGTYRADRSWVTIEVVG